MIFKGHSWEELGEAFGADFSDYTLDIDDDTIFLTAFDAAYKTNPVGTVTTIRAFLEALHRSSLKRDYQYPVWSGMLNITNGETLVAFTRQLFRFMWT